MIAYKFHITSKSGEDYKFVRWTETQEAMNQIIKRTKILFDMPWYQVYYDLVDEFEELKNLSMDEMKNNTFGEMMELSRLLAMRTSVQTNEGGEDAK